MILQWHFITLLLDSHWSFCCGRNKCTNGGGLYLFCSVLAILRYINVLNNNNNFDGFTVMLSPF